MLYILLDELDLDLQLNLELLTDDEVLTQYGKLLLDLEITQLRLKVLREISLNEKSSEFSVRWIGQALLHYLLALE